MTGINVLLLRGFLESEAASTTIYSNGLIRALQEYKTAEIVAKEFTPKLLLPSWLRSVWGMRIAQYILYPFQVLHRPETITHLLDYSYAHLLYLRNNQKTIVTVTDLMPVLWWKKRLPVHSKKSIPITVLYSLYALKRAAHIITISHNTKNDLVKLIGCNPSNISVVYLGVDKIFKPYTLEAKAALRNRLFGPEPKQLILITGSQFYKNHETALKTIALLIANGRRNIYLVKTGDPTQDWLELLKKYGLKDNVIHIGFIPREQMPDLYNAVDLLMFPSIYEGFGWPPLEAMACGTPVVASNVASLPEVLGSIDAMCDPFDYLSFAKKIDAILSDSEFRTSLINSGLVQASKFNWAETARQVAEIYNFVGSKAGISLDKKS